MEEQINGKSPSSSSSKKNKPRRRRSSKNNNNKQTPPSSPPPLLDDNSNSNIFIPPMPNFISLSPGEANANFTANIDQAVFYLHKSISEMKVTDLAASNPSPKKAKNQQNQQNQLNQQNQRKDNKSQANNMKVVQLYFLSIP